MRNTFQDYCKEAIEKGYMQEADLDTALVRVFEARFSVGEFDNAPMFLGEVFLTMFLIVKSTVNWHIRQHRRLSFC